MEAYDSKKIKYFEMVKEPEFNELKREEQEKVVGVDRQTLWRWSKEVNWDKVREDTRKRYSQEAPKVFSSIVKRALKGDGKAQELYLEYFLGWSPKQIRENINSSSELRELSDEELKNRRKMAVLTNLSDEELKKALEDRAAVNKILPNE